MFKKKEKKDKLVKKKFKLKTWYSNRYQLVLVQRNILLLLTLFSVISMVFAVIFVKYVVSSKSLEPYVIEIEEKSGVATVVDQSTTKNFTGNDIVQKYFINQFIQSAIGYDAKTYKLDAEKVRLFSVPDVYNDFTKRLNYKNLGAESKIAVRIKSIQLPNPTTAQVRIAMDSDVTGSRPSSTNQIATLSFHFIPKMNLSMEERLINPLGFQVTSLLIAEEIINY